MAAKHINRVVISGNLTKEPELRSLPSGDSVASLRIASNERRKQNGEWTDVANYFTITVFGQQAEPCAKWLEKGSPVIVDGSMRWSEWTPDDGIRRERVEVIASVVQFLPRAGSNAPDAADSAPSPAPAQPQEEEIPF